MFCRNNLAACAGRNFSDPEFAGFLQYYNRRALHEMCFDLHCLKGLEICWMYEDCIRLVRK